MSPTTTHTRTHVALMIVLTFTTGIVDAVGYLGLDRVFTGNMTGNVVVLGMALVGGTGLPVLGPFLALVGFMLGAALGGRMLRSATLSWPGVATGLFAAVGTVVLLLGVLLMIDEEPTRSVEISVTTLLGVAMGAQAATARMVAVKDVTTVVVTSTITGLAADSRLGNGAGRGSARRLTAVVSILAGAATGATLIMVHVGLGLVVAGVVVLAVAGVGGRQPDRQVVDPAQ